MFEDILHSLNPENRTIISESILASLHNEKGNYINPFLSGRITEPSEFPLINELTSLLWFINLPILCTISPFIKNCYQEVFINNELDKCDSRNDKLIRMNQIIWGFLEK